MPRIVLVAGDGVTHTVEAAAGMSIMQASLNAGISGIVGECGGSMMCAKSGRSDFPMACI